jgi:hypothetical protein
MQNLISFTEEEIMIIGDYILDKNINGTDIKFDDYVIIPDGIVLMKFDLKNKSGLITSEKIRVEEARHILNGYYLHEKQTILPESGPPCYDNMSREELLAEGVKILNALMAKKDEEYIDKVD